MHGLRSIGGGGLAWCAMPSFICRNASGSSGRTSRPMEYPMLPWPSHLAAHCLQRMSGSVAFQDSAVR